GGGGAEAETPAGREVEGQFSNGATRVDFDAELEDGAVRVRERVRAAADEPVATGVTQPAADRSGPGGGGDNSGPGGGDDRSGSGHDGSGSGSSGSSGGAGRG